jgi:hypothetical protein
VALSNPTKSLRCALPPFEYPSMHFSSSAMQHVAALSSTPGAATAGSCSSLFFLRAALDKALEPGRRCAALHVTAAGARLYW